MSMPIFSLGEIFDIARGGSPRPIDAYVTDDRDGVNWILIGDAVEGSKYIRTTKKRIRPEGVSKSRVVRPGDFLLTNSMSFGRPYIVDTEGCIHDGWLVLSPRHPNVDRDYFYHLLGSDTLYSNFERLAAGATVKNLNIDLVKSVRVALPPIDQQRRFADILDRADGLRAKRRAALAQIAELKQSIFLDMFGDPLTNPNDWPEIKLESACRRITVGIVVRPASYYVPEGVPALRSLNVKPGRIVLDSLVHFSEEDNRTKLSKTRLTTGDVVVVRSGQPGTAAVIPSDLDGINAIDLLIVTPDHDVLSPIFLCHYLNSSAGRRIVLGQQRGQVQKHLNVHALADAIIPAPPLPLQRVFADRIAAVQTLHDGLTRSTTLLDELFASLKHRAFRGEL